jgi:hypothetical protein
MVSDIILPFASVYINFGFDHFFLLIDIPTMIFTLQHQNYSK